MRSAYICIASTPGTVGDMDKFISIIIIKEFLKASVSREAYPDVTLVGTTLTCATGSQRFSPGVSRKHNSSTIKLSVSSSPLLRNWQVVANLPQSPGLVQLPVRRRAGWLSTRLQNGCARVGELVSAACSSVARHRRDHGHHAEHKFCFLHQCRRVGCSCSSATQDEVQSSTLCRRVDCPDKDRRLPQFEICASDLTAPYLTLTRCEHHTTALCVTRTLLLPCHCERLNVVSLSYNFVSHSHAVEVGGGGVRKWVPSSCHAFFGFWLSRQCTDYATIANGTCLLRGQDVEQLHPVVQKCALRECFRIAARHTPQLPNPATETTLTNPCVVRSHATIQTPRDVTRGASMPGPTVSIPESAEGYKSCAVFQPVAHQSEAVANSQQSSWTDELLAQPRRCPWISDFVPATRKAFHVHCSNDTRKWLILDCSHLS